MIQLTAKLTTDFHRSLATADWLCALEQHVEQAISARPELQSCRGYGWVWSDYSDQRHMGPNSAVKFHFQVEVLVGRNDGQAADTFVISVRYLPQTRNFETRGERVDTVETREAEVRHSQQLLEVTKTVAGQLRERFEGKEAICVEKGLLWRVRVENIRAAMALYIEADLVRITSNSFETLRRQYGLQWAAPLLRGEPQRWGIGGGWQMTGSENSWHMGYGGWSLYFEPALVRAVEEQANRLPDNLDGDAHHRAILKIVEPAWFEQRDVFPFLAIAAVAAKSRTAQFQPFEQAQPIDAHECALESAVETIMNGRWRVYRTPVGNLLSILAPEEIRQAGGLAPEAVAGRLRYVSPGIAGWNFSPNLKFLEFLHQVIETSALTDPEFLEIARQHGRDTVFIKNGTDTDTYIGTFEISDGKPVPGSYRPCNRYCIMSQKDLAGLPTWVERAVVARLSGRH